MAIGPELSSDEANTEPSSSQPRFGVTSAHVASGPGSVRRPRCVYTHGETDERGEGDGEAVGADGRDADDGEHHAEDDAHDAVAAHHDGVLAEAARARADAAGEVHRRVRREAGDEGEQHHPLAVEVVGGDQRAEGEDRQSRRSPAARG